MSRDLVAAAGRLGGGSTTAQTAVGLLSPIKEPQRTYMWEVAFQDDFNTKNIYLAKHYAMSAGIPTISQNIIRKRYMGAEYYYLGRENSPKNIRITFWDNQNMDMYELFNDWMKCGQSGYHSDLKANPNNYYKTIFLKMKDTSDIFNKRTIVLNKCFPVEITQVSLGYGESSHIQVEVTFQFQTQHFEDKPSFIKQIFG